MVDRSSAILIIIAFFTLILGVSLLTSIASQEQEMVSKDSISNETFDFAICRTDNAPNATINNTGCNRTLTQAPTGWKLLDTSNPCPLTGVVVRNCTAGILTITTDYVIPLGTGVIELKNTSDVICGPTDVTHALANKTFIDYNYCPDDYLTQSWQRNLMDVVVGFFALTLMVISVGLFYSIAKKEGIIGT